MTNGENSVMKKMLLACVCCILCFSGCVNNQKANFDSTKEEQIEKEITTNLKQLAEETDMASSNPFDYIKNEYYENIVNLGKDAVPVLEKMYQEQKLTGLYAYLSALAIQDITKCNLYEKYHLNWSTAEEFYTLWKENNCSYKK